MVWLLACMLAACSSGEGTPDADGDDDGDSGADGDGDGDSDGDSDTDADFDTDVTPDPGIALRDDGWLRGDLHQHTAYSDAGDPLATVIAIHTYLSSELFLSVHPEYEGNGLDFAAITDHRTVGALDDPAWETDEIILVPAEEFGTSSHANRFGISEHVDEDPGDDGITLDDLEAAVTATHAEDGIFSINHPFLPDLAWPWDVRDLDSLEVWNAGWALMSPDYTPEALAAWEAANGPASPLFRRAVEDQGIGGSTQSLVWYEAQLARGIHVALVGGSDRHTLLMPAFPTTWIRAESPDLEGLLQGLRDRHTFVSRTPVSTQVLMEVEVDGTTWEMGDAIPIAAEGASAVVRVRVGRGDGGLVQVVAGGAVASDEALEGAPLGEVVLEDTVTDADFTTEVTLDVTPGSWVYPVVLDPLVSPGSSEERAERVRALAEGAVATGPEDYTALANLMMDMIDFGVALGVDECDPADWRPELPQCVPIDDENMTTYFLPDYIDRAFNAMIEDGGLTEWCMGAVGSAVMFVVE